MRRSHLHHLAPPARNESRRRCPCGHLLQAPHGGVLVGISAPVVRHGQSLALGRPRFRIGERGNPVRPRVGRRARARARARRRCETRHAHDAGPRPFRSCRSRTRAARSGSGAAAARLASHPGRRRPRAAARSVRESRRHRAAALRAVVPRRVREERPGSALLPRIRCVRLVGIGLVAGLFSALFGVGGGLVIVSPADHGLRIRAEGGDGDVARRDRHDGARGRGPLCAPRQGGCRLRGARRHPGDRRRARRHGGAAAPVRSCRHDRLRSACSRRSASGCSQDERHDGRACGARGTRRRRALRAVRRRWRHPVRAGARGARPRAGRGRSDLTARNRADCGRRRRGARRGTGTCASGPRS